MPDAGAASMGTTMLSRAMLSAAASIRHTTRQPLLPSARGFLPEDSVSLHYLPHAGFREAVARFCDEERRAMAHYRAACFERLPFQRDE